MPNFAVYLLVNYSDGVEAETPEEAMEKVIQNCPYDPDPGEVVVENEDTGETFVM